MSTPEGRVKDKVKNRFTKEFPKCYRFMPVQNGMGSPSLDFLYCIDGIFVGVETKAEPKAGCTPNPTPRQQSTMASIKDAGGLTYLIYNDATLEQAIATIWLHCEFGRRGRKTVDQKARA